MHENSLRNRIEQTATENYDIMYQVNKDLKMLLLYIFKKCECFNENAEFEFIKLTCVPVILEMNLSLFSLQRIFSSIPLRIISTVFGSGRCSTKPTTK